MRNNAICRVATMWVGLLAAVCGPAAGTDLYQASAAAEKQDYARAFELFRPLAELGHGNAQEHLAVMYVNGKGVRRDNALGYAWARLAMENGGGDASKSIVAQLEPHLNPKARERIAEVHAQFGPEALNARLLPQAQLPAETNATPCRMKAAANPDSYYPSAARIRGITGEAIVEVKVGADGSVRLPRAWYSFPADSFEEAARAVALNSRYTPKVVNGTYMPCKMRFKVKFSINDSAILRPPAEAMRIVADLRKKAYAGDPDSQYIYGLASSLRKEFRSKEDGDRYWFLEAAKAGIPAAQFLVGVQLMAADSPTENAKGLRWLEMSANAGNGAAMTALGTHFLGAAQDAASREQGFEWLKRAAGTPHREGKYFFAALLASWPDAARRDPVRALALMDETEKFFDYDPLSFEIRAAALAGQGDFAGAKRAQARALSMARGLDWNIDAQQERLQAYEAGSALDKELVNF